MNKTLKIIVTILAIVISAPIGLISFLILTLSNTNMITSIMSIFVIPGIIIPLIWLWNKRKYIFYGWLIFIFMFLLSWIVPYGMERYNKSLTINTSPNIHTEEYLPFDDMSKIVKISSNFKLNDNLPIVDGAAAVFPVYSAFVHATYPNTTKLNDGVFEYNNTSIGYSLLAEGETDIFFGAYPSKDQIKYAEECGNPFNYTKIGTEAFVFFVHKDNPINNLTTEQIKGIYSGKITNWKEVGGKNEKIVAYQRNEGSGSQSMLKRFMEDTPIMEAPSEQINDMMVGIINRVADYKSTTASIGFSFRYYVEGIIQNPDIKMISIDNVAPTVENIKNGSYPIVTHLYAVTNKNEDNENVARLVEWILSEEGQYIIEETGYVGMPDAAK